MKKLLLVPVLALSLSGCAGMAGLASTARTICANEESARVALFLAMQQATLIEDEARREAALAAIRVSLAAFEACPQEDSS